MDRSTTARLARARRRLSLMAVAVAAGTLASSCTPAAEPDEPAVARQLSTEESAETAPGLLERAGLELPASATEVRVDLAVNEPYAEASVVRFEASRADADALCTGAGESPSSTGTLPAHEAEMLGAAGEGSTGCTITFDDAGTARVVLGEGEPVETAVLVYDSPAD